MRARALVTVCGVLMVGATTGACRAGDADESASAGESPGPTTTGDPALRPRADLSSPDPAPDEPPEELVLPGEGPAREYRMVLINTLDAEVEVHARAGAARVALDTVPAGDSARVDIRVRAEEVALDAEDSTGAIVLTEVVRLAADTLNRWVISRARPRPAISDTTAGSLVTPDTAGYPRTQPTSGSPRR